MDCDEKSSGSRREPHEGSAIAKIHNTKTDNFSLQLLAPDLIPSLLRYYRKREKIAGHDESLVPARE